MSSFYRGHANLLCVIPTLAYMLPKQPTQLDFEEALDKMVVPRYGVPSTEWHPNNLRITYYTQTYYLSFHDPNPHNGDTAIGNLNAKE